MTQYLATQRSPTYLRGTAVLLCLAWAASIFATSSTVVTPVAFFQWFHEHVFRSDASFQRFQLFWAAWWIVIVKGWHVTEFAILMALTTSAVRIVTGIPNRRSVLVAGLLCLVYAASDEWHQTFVPERQGVVLDVVIDSVGIVIAGIWMTERAVATNRCRPASPPAPSRTLRVRPPPQAGEVEEG